MKSSVIKWSIITVFWIVALNIYNHFGHGVYSNFMNFVWIPSAIMIIVRLLFTKMDRIASQLLVASAWTLSIGMFLKGVFDIANTSNNLIYLYPFLGIILLAGGIIRIPYAQHQ
ncbi:MAG: hypothetical protein LBM27_06410 [Lactobacillaceae bacterium]|jgi:hypothetical protein|nr:hypothetical protein [Lactobacillaceae bacterium]